MHPIFYLATLFVQTHMCRFQSMDCDTVLYYLFHCSICSSFGLWPLEFFHVCFCTLSAGPHFLDPFIIFWHHKILYKLIWSNVRISVMPSQHWHIDTCPFCKWENQTQNDQGDHPSDIVKQVDAVPKRKSNKASAPQTGSFPSLHAYIFLCVLFP